ncbi:MAG: NfeD family protein [Armatimonadetes bacterium]|nr:NfeD family protein [Armatimonadota bacterium]
MLAAYIVAAIVGVGLIVFSALEGLGANAEIGGGDLANDVDASHGPIEAHDAGGHADYDPLGESAEGAVWLPFLSVRFWTYAVGTFGLLGTLLTLANVSREPLTAIVAVGTALLTGTIAAVAVRALSKMERTSSASETDFLGVAGKVTVPIRGSLPGKVRTSVKGDLIDLVAVSDDGGEILQGEEVVVIEIDGRQARVSRCTDILGE